MAVIETDGLTKLYGRARGIEDVTFSVESGEVFGLLGPNGTVLARRELDLALIVADGQRPNPDVHMPRRRGRRRFG